MVVRLPLIFSLVLQLALSLRCDGVAILLTDLAACASAGTCSSACHKTSGEACGGACSLEPSIAFTDLACERDSSASATDDCCAAACDSRSSDIAAAAVVDTLLQAGVQGCIQAGVQACVQACCGAPPCDKAACQENCCTPQEQKKHEPLRSVIDLPEVVAHPLVESPAVLVRPHVTVNSRQPMAQHSSQRARRSLLSVWVI